MAELFPETNHPGLLRKGLALSKRLITGLQDQLLPPLCYCCQTPVIGQSALCPDCWKDVPWIEKPVCERLGLPLHAHSSAGTVSSLALADPPPWHRARAAARYDGIARKLIIDFKFKDGLDLAPFLAQAMQRAGRDLFEDQSLLIPIPIHWRRLWRRRYNQSWLLAQSLSRLTGLACHSDYLIRSQPTLPQVGLSRDQRRRNVSGAFIVPDQARLFVTGRTVILIDDVLTSGATASAATRTLLRAGARDVNILCFARVSEDDALLA